VALRPEEEPMKFRTKLLLFNSAIVLALTALTVILGYDFRDLANLPAQRQSIELKASANIRQLSRASEVELATANTAAITRLVESYKADVDLSFVRIWNKDGKQLGGHGEAPSMKEVTSRLQDQITVLSKETVAIWRPVEIEGVRLGTVSLGYSLARIQAAQSKLFLFFILVVIAAGLSAIASFFFSAKLTRPVLKMTQAFRRMADGDLTQESITVDASDETGEMARAFNDMLEVLTQLGQSAQSVAEGNLEVHITAKGDLAEAFRQMIASQQQLVRQIAQTAVQLTSAVTEFQTNAEQQERGAVEQSSAVEENRRTMDSLLESARQVSETAQGVLKNAERTQNNSSLMADRIAALSAHAQRITEILQVIKEIANKSDLLALNAALEGTKAGEAGRGFSLVANQMQRLAESVMASVRDIKELTDTIAEATRSTVLATEESTKLASDTTRSARQIVMIIQQQQTGTEQVTKAMDDVAQVARETAVGSKQIVASAKDLGLLSDKLRDLVGRFAVEGQDRGQGDGVTAG
jgi:methyl-accepting chemotaxis protein